MSWVTKTLRQPITAHGEVLTVLELREPTMGDMQKIHAFPYTVSGDSATGEFDMRPKPQLVGRYIEELAAIPPSSVKQLHPADVFEIGMLMIGFFTGGSASANSKD